MGRRRVHVKACGLEPAWREPARLETPAGPCSAAASLGRAGLAAASAQGRPLLRQVRLGRVDGDRIEILSGLMAGEPVVTDPQAAARTPTRAPAR